MFIHFSKWIYTKSTGRVTLAGLLIFFAFSALVLPAQSADAGEYSAGAGSPDTAFFYTPTDLYSFAEAYGERGRAAYIQARFTFDLLWPLVYTFFLATSISWVFGRVLPDDHRWRAVNLAPVLGMLFDYLENMSASIVMARFPETTPIIEWLAPLFSLLKWSFISASFLLLLAGALLWMARRVKDRGAGGG